MAITRERFNQGKTYEQYLASMTRNREQVEANEGSVELSEEDLAPFKALPAPLSVLGIVEDWCADVVANLPLVARLARESGKLNLRLFERDQNKDLMAQYMNGPFESIPVFAFFDRDFNQVGLFTERPDSVTKERERMRREIFDQNPEFGSPDAPADQLPEDVRNRLQQSVRDMRAGTQGFYVKESVRELREIIQRVPVGR